MDTVGENLFTAVLVCLNLYQLNLEGEKEKGKDGCCVMNFAIEK